MPAAKFASKSAPGSADGQRQRRNQRGKRGCLDAEDRQHRDEQQQFQHHVRAGFDVASQCGLHFFRTHGALDGRLKMRITQPPTIQTASAPPSF
jgi:hypothetical protein